MIKAGSIGTLGAGLNQAGLLRALASNTTVNKKKAKSVIYIFLSGGLSQIDTFDMKPNAPLEIRGEFSSIKTKTPAAPLPGAHARQPALVERELRHTDAAAHARARRRHGLVVLRVVG